MCSCTPILTCSCIHLLMCSYTPMLMWSCTPVIMFSCTHMLTCSCTHILTWSYTFMLTWSYTPMLKCRWTLTLTSSFTKCTKTLCMCQLWSSTRTIVHGCSSYLTVAYHLYHCCHKKTISNPVLLRFYFHDVTWTEAFYGLIKSASFMYEGSTLPLQYSSWMFNNWLFSSWKSGYFSLNLSMNDWL